MLPQPTIEAVHLFNANYVEENAISLPGRIPGSYSNKVKVLPSSETKIGVWHVYETACKVADKHPVSNSKCLLKMFANMGTVLPLCGNLKANDRSLYDLSAEHKETTACHQCFEMWKRQVHQGPSEWHKQYTIRKRLLPHLLRKLPKTFETDDSVRNGATETPVHGMARCTTRLITRSECISQAIPYDGGHFTSKLPENVGFSG